jgi:OOP family OmpA-OmpF porin
MERQLVETGSIRLENVYFETASAQLLPESETTLREAGETLEKYPNLRIEVQGYTDTRGAAAYNMRLSQSRAESVRAFLIEHFQLERDNLTARGYGETQPETAERNDEELLRNRRVVLKVMNPEALPRGVKVENKE